ncbi:4-hydroxythreonine-4-phosphate dehydrogenase [Rubricella aquisinus]|uniref:4-hydroxythreonine-4-phosphate dehydrogenase n=2 Tax=Rubricella aquisinus TaxID=2028108 RepID=A0A840WLA9_9RHOB|nr:4-hydroxythreonine-4-phosphate dehydrogenase [Rubricella aquisinus]
MLPLALTLGDPSGIGPELTLAAWRAQGHPFAVFGCAALLRSFAPEDVPIAAVANVAEAAATFPHALPVIDIPLPAPALPGTPDLANAAATIAWIEAAVTACQNGDAAALVTNPINKKVLKDGAAFAFPGHTEFLAHLTGAARPVMMLAGPDLRVVPVTIHIPLSDVPRALTADLLEETIRVTATGLARDLGLSSPRIAVAGLNPHAGEGGAMGHEDAMLIAPVLDRLRAEGMTLSGPLPADTMFHARARAGYDVAVCMYHDQALIPIKTLNFEDGVNVTLGLPIIRTSPDHGTAYDIAGKGIADPRSLMAAIAMAGDMAQARWP